MRHPGLAQMLTPPQSQDAQKEAGKNGLGAEGQEQDGWDDQA